jgi:ArsR family transcriptional regulator, cadmium/lead-responsive transcriptional repressor
VVDLTAHLGLAQSTTSAHLACLRDCGLVSVRTVGRSSVYSLAVADELMGVFGAAERMLAATGDAVTLCPTNIASPTDVADPTDVAGPMNLAGATNRGTVPS